METTTEISSKNELFTALSKAQAMIKNAEKDGHNPHFGKAYSTLAGIWDACREPLTKNELCVIQELKSHADGKLFVVTILGHKSGQSHSCVCPVISQRNDMQGYGSAITYAKRYSLAAMVGVASAEDDDDGEGSKKKPASDDNRKPQPQNKPAPSPEPFVAKPLTNGPGDYLVEFSNGYKGKRLREMKLEEVEKLLVWQNTQAKVPRLDFVNAATAWIKQQTEMMAKQPPTNK